jgi:hypothetical protein
MTSLLGEAIEEYAETAKDLGRKWRDYASDVAANLDSGYDANRASADLGTAVSLTIETGARLAWNAVGAAAILTDALNRPGWLTSRREFSTGLKGASLELTGHLKNSPGQTISSEDAEFVPAKLGLEQTRFRIRVKAGSCPAGIYRGTVSASIPSAQPEAVPVRIEVP